MNIGSAEITIELAGFVGTALVESTLAGDDILTLRFSCQQSRDNEKQSWDGEFSRQIQNRQDSIFEAEAFWLAAKDAFEAAPQWAREP